MNELADLKGNTIDTSSPAQLPIDAVLRKEIKRTTNIRNTEIIMIASQVKEQALVNPTPLNNTVHYTPVLHPLILILLHC